jgi:RHS repeat-associated protein
LLPGNRIDKDGLWTYSYDQAGNLTGRTSRNPQAGQYNVWTCSYDHANRLVKAESVAATDAERTDVSVVYVYDAEGRLVSRVETRLHQDATGFSGLCRGLYYQNDGSRVWAVYGDLYDTDEEGDRIGQPLESLHLLYRYLNGAGLDEVWGRIDSRAEYPRTTWSLTDRQNSVIAVLNNQGLWRESVLYRGGREVQRTTPLEWGLLTEYTGRPRDQTTGLQYNRARWYDPGSGRFISEDPLGPAGGLNLYRYVGNSPYNASDPTGLWAGLDDLVAIGGGALVGVIGQGVSDLLHGKLSGWENYVGAAVGGAAYGETLLYTANPWLAGGAAGAAGDLTTQRLRWASGKQQGIDWAQFGVATTAGFIGGGLGGTVFSRLAGPGGQATFRAVAGAGIAGGVSAGAIGGAYQGALQAATRGDSIWVGALSGAGVGALEGGLTGLATGGLVYGGIKAAPYVSAYGRALAWELRTSQVTLNSGFSLQPILRAAGRARQAVAWQAEFDALPDVSKNGRSLEQRYLEHLAEEGENAKSPAAFARITLRNWNNPRNGNSFDTQFREAIGADTGKGSKPTKTGDARPDLPVGEEFDVPLPDGDTVRLRGVTDHKDVLEIYNSRDKYGKRQLQEMFNHADENGVPMNLVISLRTRYITGEVADFVRTTNGVVLQFDPATGRVTRVNIGNTPRQAWKRPGS